jgi:diadenosine tetraphosphate (Ap4A) HIT family hydrolase
MMTAAPAPCELCESTGGTLLWQNDLCRVVAVADADYPGYCRVILGRHAREMTDLTDEERHSLLNVVLAVEAAVREAMAPDKMNLASLGNMTPHVHWHVIPRFHDDRHFPGPVWSEQKRVALVPAERGAKAQAIAAAIAQRLGQAARP